MNSLFLKRIVSFILAMILVLGMIPFVSITASAATNWPSLSTSAYCEFTATNTIYAYRNSACTLRGTITPYKSYNAYIAKGDICRILQITSSWIKVAYPTSSGYRTAYINRSDIFGISAPSEKIYCNGKVTVYKNTSGTTYGSTAKGDDVYACGTSGNYTRVIYTAKSGSRAYKMGFVKTTDYNNIIKSLALNSSSNSSNTSLRFPLKGSIKRSSSATTNGIYCDYKTGGSVGVYAPANGTVVFRQAYRNRNGGKMLSSYGNYIEFTSSDGVYKVKMCHLNSFSGIDMNVKKSLSYPCSGSDGKVTLGSRTVKQGELLGYSGMTGNASGHHLHLEVYKNGKAVNPLDVFKAW